MPGVLDSSRWRWGNTHLNKPVRELQTSFLLWICSRGEQRRSNPASVRIALAELHRRFADGDRVDIDLLGPAADLI